jgi:pyruvate/2-oxoglutarate/acetoin dehydrogenase E1 component
MKYFEQLCKAMDMLSEHPDTIFLGQSIVYPGTGLFDSISHLPAHKKYEMPVAENLQMGVSIGLSLAGKIPVSIYPRWNFIIGATDQIVNHLDKLILMSNGTFIPKVIVRVSIGSVDPVDPQDQHKGDFTDAFRLMCNNINIIKVDNPDEILPMYHFALHETNHSTIVVENADFAKTK